MRVVTPFLAIVFALGASPARASQCVQGKLTSDDGLPSERLGGAVSLFGTRALIGSAKGNHGGTRTGTATLFERSGGLWTQEVELVASDADDLDRFGHAVSLSDAVAVVGAPQNDDSGPDSGSAYVFEAHRLFLGPDRQALGERRVVLRSVRALGRRTQRDRVGRGLRTPMASWEVPARVYVFERQIQGWQETAKVVAPDGAAADGFGFALDFDGEVAVMGAPFDDDASLNSGSAYVFENTMVGWVLAAKLQASDAAAFDQFGEAVGAGRTNSRPFGAPSRDAVTSNEGAVYVFEEVNGNWQEGGDAARAR